MGSNFTVFESAVSALSANTQALSVVGNNIANVNTPGYSRQSVLLSARNPQRAGGVELGLGVNVHEVLRTFDAFAELRLRDSASDRARFDALATNINHVETAFNEIGRDGLTKSISDFFNSMHDLANDPTSLTARNNVINKATVLEERFHTLAESLTTAQELIDGDVRLLAEKVDSLANEIVNLNLQIQSADAGGDLALRDQRQIKVKELAEIVDISAVETSDGVFQIYMGDGFQLVNGAFKGTVSTAVDNNNDGLLDLTFAVGSGAPTDISARINSGSLKGLLEARDTYIPNYMDKLDELAFELVTEFNSIHSTGYDLNGNTRIEFFDENTLTTEAAGGADLLTQLRNSSGAHLRILSGDTITIAGTVGATPFSTNVTVTSSMTLTNISASVQAAIRAAGAGTETAVVQADGSIRVTAGASAITGLNLNIAGNTTFNTAFTFPTPIAAAGTGDSDDIQDAVKTGAARLFGIDSGIENGPRTIAASSTSAGLPGNNTIALSLANLQTSNITFSSGSATLVSYFGSLLSNIGNDTLTLNNRASFTDSVFRQAEIQREKISGVSIEEEQLNLVKYQAAFQAASRLVSVAADILERLANLG